MSVINRLSIDFILSFCRDMIPEQGEDSYCYSFCDHAGLIGVFDGCGGAGARKHSFYSGKTEAYMASRLCAGAFYDSFRSAFPCDHPADRVAGEIFLPAASQRLKQYQPPKEETGFIITGSMIRTLPTTAATAFIQSAEDGSALISAIWAGDSRVYLLDTKGLAQLSVDDTTVPDPMENTYEDGILKNIFCSDRPVKLHCKTVRVEPPFVVLAATDGCFGYVSTPMEFEGILLGTLLTSQAPADWEEKISQAIGCVAGDDHTLCLASVGFGRFSLLQKCFQKRFAYIQECYLSPVAQLELEDRQSRYLLWRQYKKDYLRYLKDDIEEWKS